MWAAIIKGIEIAIGAGGLLWTIFGTNTEAEEARRRADLWFNWFCVAVIVIVVQAFIIWRKHRSNAQAIEKPERM